MLAHWFSIYIRIIGSVSNEHASLLRSSRFVATREPHAQHPRVVEQPARPAPLQSDDPHSTLSNFLAVQHKCVLPHSTPAHAHCFPRRSALPARGAAASRALPALPRRVSVPAPLRLQPLRSASETTSTTGLNGSGSSNGNGAAAEHAHSAAAAAAPDTATAAAAAAGAGAATAVNENFKGDMLKPSVVNTPLVR